MTYQMFPERFAEVDLNEYVLKNRKGIFIPWIGYLVYNIFVLSDSIFNPISIITIFLLGITALIVMRKKKWLIGTFLIIHTLLQFHAYFRFYYT